MAWWFDRWLDHFDKFLYPDPPNPRPRTQQEIDQEVQQRLAEQARQLLNELLTNWNSAGPQPTVNPWDHIQLKVGMIIRTTSGRAFYVADHRAVQPGEFHFCSGQIYSYPSILFPGHPHTCWILRELSQHHSQARPPKPPPAPADRLARHLRTLGFKKADHPTPEAVRARYLELAKRYHPDLNPRGQERMKRITEAYRNYQELTKQ